MMKKIVYIFLFLLCVSCYKDKSNNRVTEVLPIVIELQEGSTERYTVSQYDSLIITPKIEIKNAPDADVSCKWTIMGNTIEPTILSTDKHLRTIISIAPQVNQYTLVLEATDKKRGLQKFKQFYITVKASLSEGIVIADTKDGINSDLSVISSRHFSNNKKWPDTKIFRNIYSMTNGATIQGLVKEVRTRAAGTNRTLTVMTDHSIIRADYYDYKRIDKECDLGMFMFPPKGEFKPCFIELDNYYGQDLVCLNGLIYPCPAQNNGRLCETVAYASGRLAYNITHTISIMYGPIWMFDSMKENFLIYSGNKMLEPKPQNPNGAFNVNNFKGWEPLYFGQAASSEIDFVMRHKTTGKINVFVGSTSVDNGNNIPKRVVDITDTEGLKDAKFFTMNPIESRLYFASESAVYSVSLDNGARKLQYTPLPGEKITGIKIWTEYYGKIRNKNETKPEGFSEIGSLNRMMLVMTYNETTKEGKLIVVPIATVNAELEQDRNFHVEYGGFGRILKVNRQDK